MKHLGDVIRSMRKDAGMSLRQLASRSGVDASSLSRLERHQQHMLAPNNMARIAQALRTTVAELEAQVGQDGDWPMLVRWPSFEEIVERDPNLTKKQKAALVAVYEAYVRQ